MTRPAARLGLGTLRGLRHALLPPAAWLLLGTAASAVSFDWVTVGDPGNGCDTQSQGCFGAVATAYRISKHEVTNAQYVRFLNAADPDGTNPNGIYNPSMTSNSFGGIDFDSGSASGAKYAAKSGRGDMPVNFVSWYDSLRFINWLHNGQGSGDTETGAYTFSGATSVGAREAGAIVFLPSEDEWYKAAYFDGTSYFDYPAGSDVQTTCSSPNAAANRANCDFVENDLTDVGSYTGSGSPYGTFDQGGNVWEWNETTIGSNRGLRGGFFLSNANILEASSRSSISPENGGDNVGFRVASPIPEPSTAILVAAGLTGLAARHRRSR